MSFLIPPERIAHVCGFGMTSCADGYAFQPHTVEEISAVFEVARKSGRRVVLRGAGRSYGDASILPEQIILNITAMNRVLAWDKETGIIEVESGATIEDLWRKVLPDGWWPPVVSGTMFPTVAGVLAMNIHGKNNFAAGPLGEHVVEMEVATPKGELLVLKQGDPLMMAFISSAGLLGVITRVKLQMKHVGGGMLRVLALSQPDLDHQIETFERLQQNEKPDYLVSWIDCFARDTATGRGLIHAAWYDSEAEPPSSFDLPSKILGVIPKSQVWRFLKPLNNRAGMRLLNAAKHLSSKLTGSSQEHTQSLVEFSFLLDYVPDWRNAYLPGGFIQFQSFVPREFAAHVFKTQIKLQQIVGLEAFLGVMKRHRADDFLFSHAVDGYSLALDFKVTAANNEEAMKLCHLMNDVVLAARGRFYFAKDSTLRPEDVQTYLGKETLARYRQLKQRFDPEGLLSSGLAERLNLA